MASTTTYPHIAIDSGGCARIGTTRYKVAHLAAEHHRYGWSAEELLRQHPDLRPEEVYAALTYFYDHHEAMLEQMERDERRFATLRAGQTLTREELLARRQRMGD